MPDRIFKSPDIEQEIFVMNLSHEIRTPLNLIHSTIQLLEKYSKEENSNNISKKAITKHLNTIKKSNYRLYKLLNNLIYSLQLKYNIHQYSPQDHDIVGIVRLLTDSCSYYTRQQNKTMIFKTELEEKIIACDAFYIKKIILNLISNAIKFTKKDDIIKITIYEKSNRICISVKDTGIGIPEEKQETIFDTFYKVDKTMRRKNEGSGIGLTIVKELVELHKGSIELNSTPGQGTEFIIKLPTHNLPENGRNINSKAKISIQQNMLDMTDVELSDIYL